MKNLYSKTKTWRTTAFAVCSAFLLLCGTTVNAQTTFPFTNASVVDLTPVDGAYDGTTATMLGSSVTATGVTGDVVLDISIDVAITHTWEGDLTLKLENPDGDILTLMSRPGLAELADDGNETSFNNSGLVGATLTFSDAGLTDAETMGDFGELSTLGEDICAVDLLCDYFPSPGSAVTSATSFGDFFGGTLNGVWTLWAGDAVGADQGSIDAFTLNITTASPSFTLLKTVAVDPDPSGLGCVDLPAPSAQAITINSGDSVCYYYTATNTGDVAFDLMDFMDDQLIPLGLTDLPNNLPVGGAIILPWGANGEEITADVTNVVDVTFKNSTLGLNGAEQTDAATVTIALPGGPPANDLCANAIPLVCGVPVTGTTTGATNTGNSTECAQFAADLTVWYSFVGTGNPVQVTTCGPQRRQNSARHCLR